MKYDFVTNYKNNDLLRQSFNELTEKTFSFSLEEWFTNGYWGDQYIPYSIADGEKIIANVSVNLMDFDLDGIKKHYIQIGTVMTDKEYREQGLSRFLIEKVIEEYKDKVDGIYLFGNDRVLNFYPKFGFQENRQYQYSKTIISINKERQMEHVDITDITSRQEFLNTVKKNVCNYRFFLNNYGLATFWTMGSMSNLIYHYEEEDAYIIAEKRDDTLWLYDIISSHKVNLESMINAFGNSIKKVYLGFAPYDTDGYEVAEYREEDCTLFCLGKDLENIEKERLLFPKLSHA